MTDDPVAAQYEAYPYPHRDPKDERTRLVTGSPSQLDELAHYLFRGRLDVRGFRALVAGGGGLGALEIQGVRSFQSTQTYAAIIAIMLVGLALDRSLRVVRGYLLRWT